MSNYEWLREKIRTSKLSEEQKHARVVRISEIIFDKINETGIETFDGFDEAHGVLSDEHITKIKRINDKWLREKNSMVWHPMYVNVVTLYLSAIEDMLDPDKVFYVLETMAMLSNILDDGRMDIIVNDEVFTDIVYRRVGYEIVWNMFEDGL